MRRIPRLNLSIGLATLAVLAQASPQQPLSLPKPAPGLSAQTGPPPTVILPKPPTDQPADVTPGEPPVPSTPNSSPSNQPPASQGGALSTQSIRCEFPTGCGKSLCDECATE